MFLVHVWIRFDCRKPIQELVQRRVGTTVCLTIGICVLIVCRNGKSVVRTRSPVPVTVWPTACWNEPVVYTEPPVWSVKTRNFIAENNLGFSHKQRIEGHFLDFATRLDNTQTGAVGRLSVDGVVCTAAPCGAADGQQSRSPALFWYWTTYFHML